MFIQKDGVTPQSLNFSPGKKILDMRLCVFKQLRGTNMDLLLFVSGPASYNKKHKRVKILHIPHSLALFRLVSLFDHGN